MLMAASILARRSPSSRFSPTPPCPPLEELVEGYRAAALRYYNTLLELGGKPTRAIQGNPSWETKKINGVLHYRRPGKQNWWEIVQDDINHQYLHHWHLESRQFSDELEEWKRFRDYQRRVREFEYRSPHKHKQRYWESYQQRVRGYWRGNGRMNRIELSRNEHQQTELVTWMEYEFFQDALIKQLKDRVKDLQQAVEIAKQRLEEKYHRPTDLIWDDRSKIAQEQPEGCPELSRYSHVSQQLHYELHYGPHRKAESAETQLQWIQQQTSYLFAGISDRNHQPTASDTKDREDMLGSRDLELLTQCKQQSTKRGTLRSCKISKPTRPQLRRSQRQRSKPSTLNIAKYVEAKSFSSPCAVEPISSRLRSKSTSVGTRASGGGRTSGRSRR